MSLPTGIVWVGHVYDIGGYGNVSRNYLRMLKKLEIPVHIHFIGAVHEEIGKDDLEFIQSINRPINQLGSDPFLIIHSTPEIFSTYKDLYTFRKKIGITIFETDRIPTHWVGLCNSMDEIWVPSKFNYKTFAQSGVEESKIRIIPYGIDTENLNHVINSYSFPEEAKSFSFLYTFQFDYRKGIDLLIKSYCEEFTSKDDVSLTLKVYAYDEKIEIEKIIRSYIPIRNNLPRIYIISNKLPRDELLSLYSSCSCYISTDRACGWGMPQMEMMVMGKPVITINWGGSTEFTNENNAILIQPLDELESVDKSLEISRPLLYSGHKWAKVSEENVRKALRFAFENQEKGYELGQKAKEDINKNYSIDEIAKVLKINLSI
ncbi:glycosyltransferase family 4 protein [Peribacillus sp. NPDC096448]|uniref:glycosyltransferase family 4 protein n=1 Tax=Peribacillus sp. NPDC096448 TaxID=3364395 RepID=UPI0037F240D0